jgi:hypothetical protein
MAESRDIRKGGDAVDAAATAVLRIVKIKNWPQRTQRAQRVKKLTEQKQRIAHQWREENIQEQQHGIIDDPGISFFSVFSVFSVANAFLTLNLILSTAIFLFSLSGTRRVHPVWPIASSASAGRRTCGRRFSLIAEIAGAGGD